MLLLARLEAALERLLCFFVGAIMIGAVAINFANVLARYVFFRPFIWAEEVMQFLNVWAVMLGAAIVTRRQAHLKMDAIHNALGFRGRRALDGLANLLALAVSLYVIVQALDMIRMLTTTGQRSVIARVPMDLAYGAIPLGFGSGVLFVMVWFLRRAGRPAEVSAPREAL